MTKSKPSDDGHSSIIAANPAAGLIVLSDDDVEQLSDLGLTPDQIWKLDIHILASYAVHLRREPKMSDVRAELTSFLRSIDAAIGALVHLKNRQTDAAYEASERISEMHRPEREDDHLIYSTVEGLDIYNAERDALSPALTQLQSLSSIAARALANLPATQRRRTASADFIRMIDTAINPVAADRPTSEETAAAKFPPSISPSSSFYQIVAICHRAGTRREGEPERAVRAYMRRIKAARTRPPSEDSDARPPRGRG